MKLLAVRILEPLADRPPQPSHRRAIAGVAAIVFIALTGCSNISGLGGTAEFGCRAPVGVPCMSVSGVHENERAGSLPSQQPGGQAAAPRAAAPAVSTSTSRGTLAPVSDSSAQGFTPPLGALRSDPTVIRIWVAPWEDADGDLVDQAYLYLQIDSGRWLIEHNREAIRRTFAPRAGGTASTAAVPASRPASLATQGSPAAQGLPGAPGVGGAIATTTGNSK